MEHRAGLRQGNLPPNGAGQASVREELLQIAGENIIYHGCDQQWYQKAWRRMSGCGPTTASSLFLYHQRANNGKLRPEKEECLQLMNEMWGYITPTFQGVHTTAIFSDGVKRFAKAHGLQAETAALDVPRDPAQRPTIETVLRFLEEALKHDLPVAFLNHNNGAEKGLYSHHWVVIVSLAYDQGGPAQIEFLDEGIIKRIDIASWLRTTTGGGGLATLHFS